MRFAYIDSHGNEVPILSVDALALRIELGAIGPDTQLFDAQENRWGPATTHEIFHTLSRDSQDDGLLAPPPSVPPPPAAEPSKPKAAPKSKTAAPSTAPEKGVTAGDLGLTLAGPAPEPPKKAPPPASPGSGLDLSLDLAPPMDISPPPPTQGFDRGRPSGGSPGTFDYGDMGSGLQLEDEPIDMADRPMGFGGGGSDAPMHFGGVVGSGDDLQLEEPMSAFSAESPPQWMAGPPDSGETMGYASGSASSVSPAREVPARAKREAKDRPSPPKFKRQRNLAGPIIMVVVVLALGVGGKAAWPLLQARLSPPPPPPARPAVVMPSIPDELMPTLRAFAEGAVADAVAELDAASLDAAPAELDSQWLRGPYLAGASDFPAIEAFWAGLDQLMESVHAGEWQLYHDKLAARLAAEGLAGDTATMLLERADSGFVAAEEARAGVYDLFDDLVASALDLHEFLVANEANIEYRPAASSTADPILEAVPSSQALGNEMLEMVDYYTDALTALGIMERLNRQLITTQLTTRLQQLGMQ